MLDISMLNLERAINSGVKGAFLAEWLFRKLISSPTF